MVFRFCIKDYCTLFTACIVGGLLAGCGSEGSTTSSEQSTVSLFVAASLMDVMEEIGDAYEVAHGTQCIYNFASSGALAQQILATPRADIFISASELWMERVAAEGKLLEGTRQIILSNSLVLIAHPESDFELNSATDLCSLPFELLAMGDPAFVPAGYYAQSWLESVVCAEAESAWAQVQHRISPAPDVRAVLAHVEASQDVLGIVYQTDFRARQDAVRLLYEVPASMSPKIEYSAAVTDAAQSPHIAQDFLAYLGGPEAAAIFERHGFMRSEQMK